MAPYRVLQIVPAMNAGGLETFIMNVYRAIDREKVQFDFLYHYDMPCFYDDEIQALGGNITKLTVRQDNNLPRYLHQLDSFFTEHPEYKVVHGHYGGFGMFYNTIAKKHGISVRAGHSHNTNYEKNLVGYLDRLMSWFFVFGLTDRFACGIEAGKALYRGKDFTFMPNGVDALSFVLNHEARCTIRKQYNIPQDALVFGHIGRFTQQKNHTYLIEIFREILKVKHNAYLLMLGEGAELEKIQNQSSDLGDRVIFAGIQSNTKSYYSAMDAFLLPSLFEGLPVVLAEAQSAGLPCFVTDTVDHSADFGIEMHFLPLNNSELWAQTICMASLERHENTYEKVKAAGYDIRTTASMLQQFYCKAYEDHQS